MSKQKIYIILEKQMDGLFPSKLVWIKPLRAFYDKKEAENYLEQCDNNIYYEYYIRQIEIE